MKVLVEIFDGHTVRGILVSKDELHNYLPNANKPAGTPNKTGQRTTTPRTLLNRAATLPAAKRA